MTKIFINVIVLSLLSAVGAGGIFWGLASIGAAAIIVPVGTALTVGFLSVSLLLAKKQTPFSGRFSPFSWNAVSLFLASWVCLGGSLAAGGYAFRQAIIAGIDPAAIANQMLLNQLMPVAAAVVAVVMAFASRDDPEEQG